eukprot:m.25863 g.25863  ORF g.25863 m.25863 type:complete len:402 (+) comp5806_c0_seq2:100-1305(+)
MVVFGASVIDVKALLLVLLFASTAEIAHRSSLQPNNSYDNAKRNHNMFKNGAEMRLMVTGCSGYVGGHFISALNDKWRGGTLHLYASGFPEERITNFRFGEVYTQRIELRDDASVLTAIKSFKPTLIIHLAAMASTRMCELNEKLCFDVNVKGTERLAMALRKVVPKSLFLYVSTDWVYSGDISHSAFVEQDCDVRTNKNCGFGIYGQSKYQAERVVASVCESQGLILRSALVYGGPSPIDPAKRSTLGWMVDTLQQQHADPLNVFTDETRSPVFVGDIADLLIHLATTATSIADLPMPWSQLLHSQSNIGEGSEECSDRDALLVLNMGGIDTMTRYEMAKMLAIMLGRDPSVYLQPTTIDNPTQRPQYLEMNSSKLQTLIPNACSTSFSKGLSRALGDLT